MFFNHKNAIVGLSEEICRSFKSLNQGFNKERARLQSIKDKQRYEHLTERQVRLVRKHNNWVRNYLNKALRDTINDGLSCQIGKLMIGCNLGWKQNINLSKQNNQPFVQIPH